MLVFILFLTLFFTFWIVEINPHITDCESMANQIRMLHLLHQRNSVQLTVYNAKLYKRNENESVQIIFPILSRIYAML